MINESIINHEMISLSIASAAASAAASAPASATDTDSLPYEKWPKNQKDNGPISASDKCCFHNFCLALPFFAKFCPAFF